MALVERLMNGTTGVKRCYQTRVVLGSKLLMCLARIEVYGRICKAKANL